MLFRSLFDPLTKMSSHNYGVFVVDENSKIVYQYNDFDEKLKSDELTFQEMLSESDKLEQGLPSEYTLVRGNTLTDWTIWIYKPTSVIMDSVWPIAIMTIIVTIVCAGIAMLIATAIAKIMVNGIEKLTANMLQVEAGNMEIQVRS